MIEFEPCCATADRNPSFCLRLLACPQIFYVTMVVLAVLGALVIYALILGDVEARTYELGMLRALGIREGALGALLTLQVCVVATEGNRRRLQPSVVLSLTFSFSPHLIA